MKPISSGIAALLVVIAVTAPEVSVAQVASTHATDSLAVIATAHGVMQAISTRDSALARRLMAPGAQLVSIPDPASATATGRLQSDSTFFAMVAGTRSQYLERIWNPSVTLHGPLAVVHAPYDFHIDGKFSHCGVDVLTMVKSRGEWRVTHIVYTTQRQGCAASPLGPPTF